MRAWGLGLALIGCGGADGSDDSVRLETGDTGSACEDQTWENTGRPFVSTWCTSCHSSSLTPEDRFGAPVGLDFDTYEGVLAHADAMARTAVGEDARMPPVGGVSTEERDRFGAWLACGLPGGSEEEDAGCEGAPSVAWSGGVCADGAPVVIDGDVASNGSDGSCVCSVTGALTVRGGGGDWPRLTSVGGALHIEGTDWSSPALREVGGAVTLGAMPPGAQVDLSRLATAASITLEQSEVQFLDLHDLEEVEGAVTVRGNRSLTYLDLSRLERVGGDLLLEDNDALPAVLGELYALRSVGGTLRIAGHAAWQGFYGCGLLESIGGDLEIVENQRFGTLNGFTALGSVGGSVRVVSNPLLQVLEGFDQLTAIEGDLTLSGHPMWVREDAFAQLSRVGGQVVVSGNGQLATVSGLVGVEDVGGIVFSETPRLVDLGGYPRLVELRGDLSIRGTGIESLSGFSGLEAIGGRLILEDNRSLERVPGLVHLRRIEGSVEVRQHPRLGTIEGLTGTTFIGGDLRVLDNPELSEAGLVPWLDEVVVDGIVEVERNAP